MKALADLLGGTNILFPDNGEVFAQETAVAHFGEGMPCLQNPGSILSFL